MAGGAVIGALRVVLGLDSAQFSAGANAAERRADRLGSRVSQSMRAATGETLAFGKAFLALGSIAGAAALGEIANRSLDYASSLGEVAQQLGVTTRDLQEYRYAATQVGISQEVMDKGLAKLTLSMGQARAGAEKPKKAFEELSRLLGRDILTSAQSAGDAIPLIAEAMSHIEDPTRRAELAVALFGKAAQKLDTLLAGGADEVNRLRDAAQSLGVVISDDVIQNADKTADRLAEIKVVLQANIANQVAQNATAIVTLANSFVTLASSIPRALQAYRDFQQVQGYRARGVAPNLASLSREGRASLVGAINQKIDENRSMGDLKSSDPRLVAFARRRRDSDYKALLRQRTAVLSVLDAQPKAVPAPRVVVPGGGAGAGPTKSGGSGKDAAAAAKRAAEEARRDDGRFRQQTERAQDEVLSAQIDLSRAGAERVALERQQLDHRHEADAAAIRADSDLSEARKQELLALNDKLHLLKGELAARSEAERQARDAVAIERAAGESQLDLLQGQADLARTAKDRRAIELEILRVQFHMLRAAQEAVIASTESTDAEKQIAHARLAALDRVQAQGEQRVLRDTRGPLGELLDSVPKGADEMNEALEGVAAGGIASVVDGLAEAAAGARSLGDVFEDVAQDIIKQLARIAIQKAIIGPLVNALSGGGGGTPTSDGTDALFAIFSGKTPPIVPVSGARARGGPVIGGRNYLIGERGPELFRAPGSGTIVANDDLPSSGRTVIHQNLKFSGGVDLATRTEVYRVAEAARLAAIRGVREADRRAR